MKNITKNLFLFFCLALLQMVFSGCSSFGGFDETAFIISLHEYASSEDPTVTRLNIAAMTSELEKAKRLLRRAFVDSRHFTKGEAIPSKRHPGRYGIRLYGDDFGRDRLMQVAAGKNREAFAVVVDGYYIGESRFDEKKAFEGIVELAPLWGEKEAKAIAEHVTTNYQAIDRNNQ